jgi:hypothetical protein
MFDIVKNHQNFLMEMMTLVSSVNIMGSDQVFIVGRQSFM